MKSQLSAALPKTGPKDVLHNSLRMGVVEVGMSCKAHFAVQ